MQGDDRIGRSTFLCNERYKRHDREYQEHEHRFAQPPGALDLAGALHVHQSGRELEVLTNGASERLLAVISAAHPEELRCEALSLEEIFVASKTLVKGVRK